MREPVSFPGMLRGQGHEATCAIDAIKASLPGTGEFTYTNYSIRWVLCVKTVAVIGVIGCYCRPRAFQLGGRDSSASACSRTHISGWGTPTER